MRRFKSRKKLTEAEAYEKINHIAMQLQSETEMFVYNLKPNLGKTLAEIDKATQFCLLAGNYASVEEAVEDTRKSVANMEWKITEDYARFLSPGIHQFVAGVVLTKKDSESIKEFKEEQMTLF